MTGYEILIADSALVDLPVLLQSVRPSIEVVLVDPDADGADVLTSALTKNPDALHVLAHGAPGQVFLGRSAIDRDALSELPRGMGDIVIYACHLGGQEAGGAFIEALYARTGRGIRAASAAVGSSRNGGSWELDITVGAPAAVCAFGPGREIWPYLLESIHGTSASDLLDGTQDSDIIFGNGGDDTINGYGSKNGISDQLYGGDGDDNIDATGASGLSALQGSIIYGGSGDDTIIGSSFTGDYISGGDGIDTIYGNGSVDEDNPDQIDGGAGDDFIYGGLGWEVIHGGADNDTIRSGQLTSQVFGDGGDDTFINTPMLVTSEFENYDGGTGYDRIVWTGDTVGIYRVVDVELISASIAGGKILTDMDGSYLDLQNTRLENISGIVGQQGKDTILMKGAGATTAPRSLAPSENWNDTISVGAGNDVIYGGYGDDILSGGVGNDLLAGGYGSDDIDGGEGFDIAKLDGDSSEWTITQSVAEPGTWSAERTSPSAGNPVETDTLTGIEEIQFASGPVFTLNTAPSAPTDADGSSNAVSENTVNGAAVGLIAASSDPDAGQNVTYRLTNNADGRFAINATTGVVTVANASLLNYEAATSHEIVVEAFDGSVSSSTRFVIAIADGNDAPAAPSDSNASANAVAEGALSGTLVGLTATSTDPNLGDTLTYSLVDSAGGRFAIDATSGVVSVANGALLDYEMATSHQVTVLVSDGEFSRQQVFTIAVTNVSDTPNFVGTNGDDVYASVNSDNQIVSGLAGNDSLTTGSGNDVLDGGVGNDTLIGGAGNDVYIVDAAGDVVTEAASAGTDEVRTGLASYVLTTNLENLTYTGGTGFTGTGNALANTITGGTGNDTLNGATGADTLMGGAGDDIYVVDTVGDVITENAGEGIDEVQATGTSYTLGSNLENLTRIGSTAFTGTGNALANTITGGIGADTLDGGAGDDILIGGLGNDIYVIDAIGDVIAENAGEGTELVRTTLASYTLAAELENLTYTGSSSFTGTGNAAANVLNGGAGNDTLDGSVGNDTLIGGAGNDVYIVDAAGDVVSEAASAGTDEVRTTLVSYTLGANLENLSYTGSVAFTGTGNALANTIRGGTGNDTLNGGAGADTLAGGAGDDIYVVDAADFVTEEAGQGTDLVRTTLASYTLAAEIEKLTYAGGSPFTGIGNAADNVITGGTGADTLDGGAGADTLIGGTGNDIYILDSAGDIVTEAASAGTDEVRTTLSSYVLGANLENLTYVGGSSFTGTGNALANVMMGGTGTDSLAAGDGNDMLDGAGGDDLLTGGLGNDTYVIDSAGDVIVENTGEGTDLVRTGLASYALGAMLENLTYLGSSTFSGTGNVLANVITGGAGNDVLDGGAGNDTLVGGAGHDVFIVDATGDIVTEAANAGIDEVRASSATYTLAINIENLTYTGSASFIGTGNALANTIIGGVGNDTLNGAGGADTLIGGAGDDIYVVDQLADVVTEGAGEGTDLVRTTLASYTLAAELENLTYAGGSPFTGIGNAADNVITGGNGADTLDGGAGNDTLIGGAGNDIYRVNSLSDVVIEAANTGTDEIRTALASYTLGTNIENLTYTGGADFNGIGNALANAISGGSGNDTLVGDAGNDTLDGGAGQDLLIGGLGGDTYVIDSVSDVIMESAGEGTDLVRTTLTSYTLATDLEQLAYVGSSSFTGTGNASANVLIGGTGDDMLDGGAGSDTMSGGGGDDTYFVDAAGDVVTENANAGTDEIRTALTTYVMANNVEILSYTGAAAFTGTGNALANTITAGIGDDTLNGGAGADILIGGLGNDTYVLDVAGDVVVENAGEGIDLVRTSLASYTLAAELENLTYIGSGLFAGTGNAAANIITGGVGSDTLDGAVGDDTLIGGTGNDTYIVDTVGDVVSEAANAGTDSIRTVLAGYVLGSNVENLTYTGAAAFAGTGNALANVIVGGASNDVLDGAAGDDTLDGKAGDDILIGGLGNDIYVIDTIGDVITENAGEGTELVRTTLASYTLAAELENLTYTGSSSFTGTGNAAANVLNGGTGNDVLDGGVGNDTLIGGAGNDVYIVDAAGDVVTEAASAGTDEVRTGLASYVLTTNLENLTYTGGTGFTGTGNALANTITGGTGNDTLNGATGADTLMGGAGDDIYVVDTVGDVITENAGEGIDEVQATGTSYTLGSNLENLTRIGSTAFTGTGNALANTITGGIGADTLDGGAGDDILIGGLGNDIYVIDAIGDVIAENAGEGTELVRTTLASYTLAAELENLTYTGSSSFTGTGNAAANVLNGGAGNDTLDGSVGNDTLIGGAGNDVYIVDAAGDVVSEAASAGTDEVRTTLVSYTLGANLENLSYTGSVAFTGTGNALANTIRGGTGNDTLNGGAGADTLAGGAGDDTLTGGANNDSFIFATGFGNDTITDFVAGSGAADVIAFDNAIFADLTAVLAAASQVGSDTVITYDANDTVTLKNVALGSLHSDDFWFV